MNTRSTNNNPASDDELRQQLWELAYGLLEPDVEQSLTARIKSDPAIARLYSEVRLQADLVGAAAQVEDSSLNISAGPDAKVTKKEKVAWKKAGERGAAATHERRGLGTNWLAVGGTVALLLLLGFGLYQPEVLTESVAKADFYFTQVSTPGQLLEGVTSKFEIETKDIDNRGRAAEVAVRLVDREGRETFREELTTQPDGRATVQVPGSVVRPGVRLQVIPKDEHRTHDPAAAVVSRELKIVEEKERTLLLTDKPFAEPGETVRFSMIGVGEFSKAAVLPQTEELMVESRKGVDVVEPMWTPDPDSSTIQGEFKVPANVDGLAMRRRGAKQEPAALEKIAGSSAKAADALERRNNERIDNQRRIELDRAAGTQAANGAVNAQGGGAGSGGVMKAGSADKPQAALQSEPLAKRDVNGEAEGQTFGGSRSAPPGNAAPPAPSFPGGARPETAAAPFSANRKNAAESPAAENQQEPGTKVAQSKPTEGKPFAETDAMERGKKDARALAPPALHRNAAVSREAGKAMEAEPLTQLAVPPALVGQEVVLVARRDQVVVARQEIKSLAADQDLDLPPEVDGRIEVQLYGKDEQEPLYRQQIVRAPAQGLQFELSGLKDSYSPGEQVKLKVRVLDESGQPAAAAVAVRVWSDSAARATNSPLLLADALLESGEQNEQESLVRSLARVPALRKARERESFQLALGASLAPAGPDAAGARAGAAPTAGAAAPADLAEQQQRLKQVSSDEDALNTELAEATTDDRTTHTYFTDHRLLADNRALVQQEYEAAVASVQAQRFERVRSVGRLLLWAGGGLMLLIGLLLLARRPLKPVVWVPAVGIAALSLALGVAWFVPREPVGWELARVEPPVTMSPAAGQVSEHEQEVLQREVLRKQVDQSEAEDRQGGKELNIALAPTTSPALPSAPTTAAPPASLAPADRMRLKDGAPGAAVEGAPAIDPAAAPPPAPASKPQPDGGNDAKAEAKKSAPENAAAPPEAPADAPSNPVPEKPGEPRAEANNLRALGSAALRQRPEQAAGSPPIPDSLYWRPLSPADSNGLVTIEFTLPAAESDYRLLLDAIGSGRIGGQQQLLHVRE